MQKCCLRSDVPPELVLSDTRAADRTDWDLFWEPTNKPDQVTDLTVVMEKILCLHVAVT